MKGTLFYLATLILGARTRRKREPDRAPSLRYFGAALMMALWGFMWFLICGMHSSPPYPVAGPSEYWDPLFSHPTNWQIPLLMGVLSFFLALLFSRWVITFEQDQIRVRRWPFPVKSMELSKLMTVERYPIGQGAVLYFKGDADFKINSFMSGQQHFLDSLEEYLNNRREALRKVR